jgi:transcriptional regulator with XRE-family HTH domain
MLGDLLRTHRRRLGLSQEDLAGRTGISARSIRKIESRQTDTPRAATVRLLADAFGLRGAERDYFCQSALAPKPEAHPERATPNAGAPGPGFEPTLVGRDREVSALRAIAETAAGGTFRIVWIGGEAGAGKSALGRRLATVLAGQGWTTSWGGVPEVEGTPPAWAWAEVIRRLSASGFARPTEAADEDLTEWLRPLLGERMPGLAPLPSAPFWQARAVVDFLRRCARARPLLIVLDDVHRAGEETLQILRYACAELVDRPVLVVGTFRPTEVSPALTATWAALAGPQVSHLELTGLAEADVGHVLAEHLGAPLAPETVRLIATRTGGNPLFVGETARLVASEGITAASELVPTGVGNVLRRRLTALPASAQAVLRTAAVIGLQVDTEVLLSLPATDPDAALDGVEAALQAGLLTESPAGAVRFSHVLVRDTIYQDLSQVRRTRLHAEVFASLERARSGDLAALAHHALASASPATARSAALRAADAAGAASAVHAHQESAALLTRAVELLELTGQGPSRSLDSDPLRLDLLCALVSAQSHAGNVLGARATRGRAVRVARQLGGHDLLARAYTAYDAPALWTLRDYQDLDRTLVDGIAATLDALPTADSPLRCRLLATLAVETESDDLERTDQASAEAIAIGRRLRDPELICHALNARYRYVAALGPDRWAELDSIGREQLTLATVAGLGAYQTQAHHILCMAQLARNDLDAAQRHLDQAVAHATTGQLGLALGILAMFNALRHLIAGRFDEAERSYAPIIDQLRAVGNPNVEEVDQLVAFCLAHARGPGTPDRMAALADRARSVYERLGDAVAEPYTRALIGAGQTEAARAVWKPREPLPQDYYWFRWTVLRAENALHLDDSVTAARCYRQLLPWAGHLPGLLHAHVTLGPVDHTLGDLAAALRRPAAAARHYTDAIVLADRLGAPHWAARSRRALAALPGTDGDRGQAAGRHQPRAASPRATHPLPDAEDGSTG